MYMLGLEKAEESEINANICWVMEKAREFQGKKSLFLLYAKVCDCVDHTKLQEILKEMGVPDHLTKLLRNLYAGQEAIVRTRHGTTDWFKIGKGVCHPAYLTYMQSTSCDMPGWMKCKLESRLLGEISLTSDLQMTPPFWQKAKGTKEPLDESERGE